MSDLRTLEPAVDSATARKDGGGGTLPVSTERAVPVRKTGAIVARRIGRVLLTVAVIAAGALAYFVWQSLQPAPLPPGFTSSNGRIEATEVDISAKLAERVKEVLVGEGDLVAAGQVVAHMYTDVLQAQLEEAEGKLSEAETAVITATKTVVQRQLSSLCALRPAAEYS